MESSVQDNPAAPSLQMQEPPLKKGNSQMESSVQDNPADSSLQMWEF